MTKSPEISPVLDQEIIKSHLSAEVLGVIDAIEIFDCIGSTQDYVKSQVPSNRLCVAERQLAGKGRRGREWVSAKQGDVLLSLSWMYDSAPQSLEGVSLAVVAEIADLLSVSYSFPVTIKWPNDLLLFDAKLAGFVVDVETGERCRVIVGMGLNVVDRVDESLRALDQKATSLMAGKRDVIDRNVMIAKIVDRMARLFMDYPKIGFSSYRKKWQSYAAYIGEHVVLQRREKSEVVIVFSGILEGVDEKGCLCVRDLSGKLNKVIDSELSLRLV